MVREAFGKAGADVAIDAVGNPGAVPQMQRCLVNGGKLFFFGIPYDLNMPINSWAGPSKFTVETKACDEWQAHGQVLTDYLAGNFDPNDFTQAQFPFEKINDAFAAIRSKEAFKVTVMMPE
jgi:threonine dehydrogenase-like Zn-dependent dehydrogenase